MIPTKRKPRRRRSQPESQLQKAVADLLDTLGWCWAHHAGEWVLRGTKEERARQMARMKAHGFKSGVPDVMVYERYDTRVHPCINSTMDMVGFGIAIELKAGRNSTTPEQDQWLEDLRARGWLTATCRTMDEVCEVLRHCRPRNGRGL